MNKTILGVLFMMETSDIPKSNKKTAHPLVLDRFCSDSTASYEIAIDECGRGPLFGRVYVGCVVLPKDPALFDGKDIKDSKKFSSKKKLHAVADYIKSHALAWHVSWVDEKVIDEINILQANMRAMHDGIGAILDKLPLNTSLSDCLAVVDGNYFTPFRRYDDIRESIVEMPSVTIEQGDAKHMGIAAASILAKAARDDYILELCEQYPDLVTRYSLDTNMGYGTKAHLDGIRTHGISQWHRQTFGDLCKNSVVNPV
jgi:ribonuclease HII